MRVQDVETTKVVKRAILRRCVDMNSLDIRVSHGVVYLRGTVERIRGYPQDINLSEELAIIQRIIHQQPGVREVIMEVQLPT
jgi:hypothetical protein